MAPAFMYLYYRTRLIHLPSLLLFLSWLDEARECGKWRESDGLLPLISGPYSSTEAVVVNDVNY